MNMKERISRLSPRGRKITFAVVAVGVLAIFAVLFASPLAAWFTMQPIGGGSSEVTSVRVGDLSVDASLNPDPPRQEGNTLILSIRDSGEKPVTDAKVKVTYLMPAMGAMSEMRGDAKVRERGKGRYEAAFDLPMGGSWTLTADIRSDAGNGEARFNMTVGNSGLVALDGAGGSSTGAKPFVFPSETLEELRRAFASYEQVRALLAADRLDGVGLHAEAIARALTNAQATTPGVTSEVSQCLSDGTVAARQLGSASSLADARKQFAEVSRFLMSLGASDKRLQEGWTVFECPMTSGFNKWFQATETASNPYMGPAMVSCGSASDWGDALPSGRAAHAHGDDAAYYTCSMHPSVKQQGPGTCPICSMDLTAVSHEELESGVIQLDPVRTQKIGVRMVEVARRPMADSVRAVGRTAYDESNVRDVTLKLSGWIEKLYVNETGQAVRRGQPLLALYSPDLFAAQQEYLLAIRSQSTARQTGAPDRADYLVRAARQRLKLWDLSDRQIDKLASSGKPLERVPLYSPYSGYVVEKDVNEGASVQAGQRLMRIASLDSIWVEADVYEADLGKVRVGQPATIKVPSAPGATYQGKVSYVYPWLDPATRTGRVRVELPNRKMELRPEMYADVAIQTSSGATALVIPSSAVLDTGPRQIVFVDLGEGRFKPQKVELGSRTGEWSEVLSGLKEGDRIVSSANFLISAESRIRSAEQFWGAD